jgi:hypothetical protein
MGAARKAALLQVLGIDRFWYGYVYCVCTLFGTGPHRDKKLFGLSYEFSLWKYFFMLNVPVLTTVLLKMLLPEMWGYGAGIVLLLFVSAYVFNKLNKKMDFVAVFKTKFSIKNENE